VREGITGKDDYLMGRYLNEPIHGGPLDGLAVDREKWDRMLGEYYDLNGWDRKTGIPTRDRLVALGLKDIADELEQMGKLP
jgi:aldehyde:ferredoxin oxidoreductase